MPYKVVHENDKYCVHKMNADGSMGETVHCHDSEEDAMAQMRAMYANEGKAVKFADGDETVIEGIGMPFGGPFSNKDLAGEYFSAKTDFCFDWFSERPGLFQHGLDSEAKTAVVGRVKSWKTTDMGIWVQAQLDASSQYFQAIKDLIKKGKLFFSSGAMAHLVDTDHKSGEIKRWPWVELSLTPTPCNLMATLDFATAKAHFKAIGMDLPDSLEAKATMNADTRSNLDDSDFAYIDSKGGHYLPIHDEAHVRNAMACFNQTEFESEKAKEKGKKKIMSAAHRMGIDVADSDKAYTVVVADEGKAVTIWAPPSAIFEHKSLLAVPAGEPLLTGLMTTMVLGTAKDAIWVLHGYKYGEHKIGMTPMMEEMMAEMDMEMSEAEMQAMMEKMGDMEGMAEEDKKKKMRAMLQEKKQEMAAGEHDDHKAVELINWLVDGDLETTNLDTLPLANHAEAVKILATSLLERTKDLQERRVKEGRVLSTGNRKRLGDCLDVMQKACNELQGLLDSTDKPAKAADVRLRLKILAMYGTLLQEV